MPDPRRDARSPDSLRPITFERGVVPYADYTQWEIGQRPAPSPRGEAKRARAATVVDKPKKLGYREKREWEQMEARILEAERELESCRQATADPSVASDHKALAERLRTLGAAQAAVDELYARWAELEEKVKA